MPALKKFDANVARHVNMLNRNLCANLIRHEYIVTGRTKAKRAQAEIERFLSKTFTQNKQHGDKPLEEKLQQIKALLFLQKPDRAEVGLKVLAELSQRYLGRTHGFTRIIKLEPRLGTDKAPMSVLELVDLDFEIKFWYTAKVVARLELQQLPVDGLTQANVGKLVAARPGGLERFREAVEEAKVAFFQMDQETGEVSPQVEKELANQPRAKFVEQAKLFGQSRKMAVKPRAPKKEAVVPPLPFTQ